MIAFSEDAALRAKKSLDIHPVFGIVEPIQFIGGGWPVKG
jgi:hypothetical protein